MRLIFYYFESYHFSPFLLSVLHLISVGPSIDSLTHRRFIFASIFGRHAKAYPIAAMY
jgi:hypothetical protein